MEFKEDEHIDDLFRSSLLNQEIPVDQHAMDEAMKLLDARKNSNARVIYWITGLLGLLAIGIGLAFFFCRGDNHANGLPDMGSSTSMQSSSTELKTTETSKHSDNGSFQANPVESDGIGATGPKDTALKEEDAGLSAQTESNSPAVQPSDKRNAHSIKPGKEETGANRLTEPDVVSKSRNEFGQPSRDFTMTEVKDQGEDTTQKSDSAPQIQVAAIDGLEAPSGENERIPDNSNTDASEVPISVTNTSVLDEVVQEYELKSDSVSTAGGELDSVDITNVLLKPEYMPRGFSKWDVRLAASGLYTISTIGQRNMYSDVYAQQRNDQEMSLPGYGLDVSLCRNGDRSFMSAGIGFMQTNENIQYDATKTTMEIASEEFWEYESVLYMIVDGTGTNQSNIIWDTSFMEVNVDSTLFVTYDTTTTTSENSAITGFNGTSNWSHLYLPLVYGIRLDQRVKSRLYVVGSLDFDYLVSSTSHYLTSDGQAVKSMMDFPGYRRFMIHGSMGIEWRKLLGGDKFYLLVNSGVRSNLYSWNAEFKHITWSPYLRVGLGLRMYEK